MRYRRHFCVYILIFATFYINTYRYVAATPEKTDCEWVPTGEITRIRDLSDCQKFYYCTKGKPPYRASCPHQTDYYQPYNFYNLYFNPKTTHCDFSYYAPDECFGTGEGVVTGVYVPVPYTTTTTTTEATTTTTRAPRPPMLDDQPDFEIDCSKKMCGLFANTYGACDTYVICVNGQKLEKKCNGGQLFDVKTRECQPASKATCWTEPTAGPHKRQKQMEECPFHGNAPTTPIETRKDGVILQNPVVTNWGNWQKWVECPRGTYATGLYAWRRLLMQGPQKVDHAGIVSLSFRCQKPGGNETDKFIESLAPGLPKDGWPMYYMCRGAVVGIRLNSVRQNGWGNDQLATDNIQAMCSCSKPAYKPYEQARYAPQNGNRGVWTTPQYCKKGQAVCGMQTQMQDYKEYLLGVYDNNGLNNIKVKCCNVPDPLTRCGPTESRELVRECDNSKSDEGLRCDFEATIGLSLNYDREAKVIEFYSSIGYTFEDAKKQGVHDRIVKKLDEEIKAGQKLEYTWDEIDSPDVLKDMKVVNNTMYLQPFENLKLYQIVGKCGHFLVRSNRFLRVTKGKRGNKETYFEI